VADHAERADHLHLVANVHIGEAVNQDIKRKGSIRFLLGCRLRTDCWI
jgi:hypothetical protein